MKSFAIFVAAIALASAIPLPLTSQQFSHPVETTATLGQLSAALEDPHTNPALLPYLENALNELMVDIFNGQQTDSINLSIPAMEVNTWTLQQLSDAIQSPATDPELKIYLEYALNQLMDALFSGNQVDTVAVVTPPGVISHVPGVAMPVPAFVTPAVVTPAVVAPAVVAPSPAIIAPSSPASPLVQIIVNVNANGQIADTPILPPQTVIDSAPVASPVSVVEHAPEVASVVEHAPEVVSVVEHAPEVVSVVEHAPEVVSVVEHAPEVVAVVDKPIPHNPIDVIAVAAPNVNPIDSLHPLPVHA